jgi:hypothetical protein
MKRIHLFEFEDQRWFPGFLRNYMTDFLQQMIQASKMFQPSVSVLEDVIRNTGQKRIIDLGSGSGGGMLWMGSQLKRSLPSLQVTFTDLFPNERALTRSISGKDGFNYLKLPVDARSVDPQIKGLRTQCLSLHHFRKADAIRILSNAVESGQPIGIFEGQERSLASLMAMLFSPISVLIMTFFIRPFSFRRMIFTYLLPLVPIFVLWDGVVSSLRTYSVKEMDELIGAVKGKEKFVWKTGRVKSGPGVNLYLVGYPKNNINSDGKAE